MKDKLIALLKGSAILTISNVCMNAIQFFLLPLYTKFLSPDQLGVSDTVTTFTSLFTPILIMGLDSAYSAFYFDEDTGEHRKKVFSSIWILLIITSIVPLAGTIFAENISAMFFGSPQYSMTVMIALLAVCCNLWYLPFALYLRVENRMTAFAIISTSATAIMITTNVIAITVFELGEASLVTGTLCGNAVMFIVYIIVCRKNRPGVSFFDKALTKKMLTYSLPLVPMVVSTWVLTSSDRMILLAFLGQASVGIYGISARFMAVVNTFTNGVYTAYTTFAFSSKNDEESSSMYVMILDVLNLMLTFIVFFVCMFSIEILDIMTADEYAGAYILLPGLLFAQLFYAANTIVSYGLQFQKKSGLMLLNVFTAAVLNVVLNVMFIPKFGVIAAALTTWAGYAVMLLMTNHFSQKVYECPYRVKKLMGLNIALLIVSYVSLTCFGLPVRCIVWLIVTALFIISYKDVVKQLLTGVKHLIKKES